MPLVEGQVPPFGEVEVPEQQMCTVLLGFVSGRTVQVEDVPRDDVDLWLATKIVHHGNTFHPMSAIETITIHGVPE